MVDGDDGWIDGSRCKYREEGKETRQGKEKGEWMEDKGRKGRLNDLIYDTLCR